MNKPQLPEALRLPAITLAAHAYEHQRPSGLMSDSVAHNWCAQLNRQYDRMPLPDVDLTNGIITRSLVIDYALLDILADIVAVCDLGCGFSTRRYRLNLDMVDWVHYDLLQVMEARLLLQRLDDFEKASSGDLCNETGRFIPYDLDASAVCFICEGVLNHLPRSCALGLLRLLHEQCPGARLIGTVITDLALPAAKTLAYNMDLDITQMWAVLDSDEIQEILEPSKVERIWFLSKVATRIGLIRPDKGDEASGFVFRAIL